ncbi:MAG: SUMF1/EgtB/PvdO family nonheme iron enzyme [Bacteroidota bacterium]
MPNTCTRPVWKLLFVAWLGLLSTSRVAANGLSIENLSRDSLAQTVTFDLQWFSSWRIDSTAAPSNWDAAWVIVKFRACSAGPNDPWIHGQLSGTLTDHNFGTLEPVQSNGAATGLDADLRGVMLRRATNGLFGNEPATTITLTIPNMLQNEAYNVRVVGIEMVFVPEGTYDLGSVNYVNAFSANTTRTDPTPASIASEAAVTINSHAYSTNTTVALAANFPKGYAAFHMMKYEISQGQYATFLNSLAPAVQYNRYPGNFNNSRNRLIAGGGNVLSPFGSDREDRAQGYLSWEDVAAYLDWACLRPMTELEYEKAARGTSAAVVDEYAWGSTNIFPITDVTAPENGTEIPGNLPANARYSNNTLIGGDGGRGPVRAGIFALSTNTTREQSGASFYGIMELSGNVREACVGVLAITATTGTVAFDGALGDGTIDAAGASDQASWPTLASGGYVHRGGGFSDNPIYLKISDRTYITWNGTRYNYGGGRGVR